MTVESSCHFHNIGALPTTATWIRQFVHTHPDYKHDSVVGDKIVYDLIKHLSERKFHNFD